MDMNTARQVLEDMHRNFVQELANAPKVEGEAMTIPSADVLADRRDATAFALKLFAE